MDAKEIIAFIQNAEKKTPVKVYLKEKKPVAFPDCKVFGIDSRVIFGDWKVIEPILKENAESIEDMVVENDCRNSAVPLLDKKYINARIEPGAVIRDQVEIGDNAVIMMGAMIDMGAVLGGRATVGKHCHIGAGAVLAGVIEPASATPVIVEDDVLIGANAVVIEGVHIGKNAVVAAGAVVIEDVPANSVVAGCPARVIKEKDAKATEKTELVDALRSL